LLRYTDKLLAITVSYMIKYGAAIL